MHYVHHPLWFPIVVFQRSLFFHSLKELKKMQHRAVLQITCTFHTSLTWGVEAIASLIVIYYYLKKSVEDII